MQYISSNFSKTVYKDCLHTYKHTHIFLWGNGLLNSMSSEKAFPNNTIHICCEKNIRRLYGTEADHKFLIQGLLCYCYCQKDVTCTPWMLVLTKPGNDLPVLTRANLYTTSSCTMSSDIQAVTSLKSERTFGWS